ncbi:hypothetical protein QYF36_019714 [Acer negundo]|nr:hypothetical protein QYF36_019714 [Acer negundo]
MAGGIDIGHGSKGAVKQYPGNLTWWGDINGSFSVVIFPIYHKEKLDTSINQYCKFNDMKLTLFTSSLHLATLVASFFMSWVTRELLVEWEC